MRRLVIAVLLLSLSGVSVFSQESPVNEALVEGNNAFAFDLYHQVAAESDANLIYSPYSISVALGMTYAGAQGTTAEQMSDVMEFLPQDELPAAFGDLNQVLAERAEPVPNYEGDPLQLHIVNALWGEESVNFKPEFLSVLDKSYDAPLNLLDFKNEPEPSRTAINDWAAEQTEDRIQNLLPEGVIDPDTRLVLTNAIYFNASWAEVFDEDQTRDEDFTPLEGEPIKVPFMHQTLSTPYMQGDGYAAADLPYLGDQVSMLVILPDDIAAFEASLDADQFAEIVNGMGYANGLQLAMPKFEYESDLMLGNTLQSMGMELAFSDEADFSGMTEDEPLKISEVIHKAFVSVDETGTEAAAATAVVMMAGSAAPSAEPPVLRLDRPFLYVIYDRPTRTVLFVGRVMNPAQ